jgi:glycolate oxidase subunit GlcD
MTTAPDVAAERTAESDTRLAARLRQLLGTDAVLSRPDELFVYECDGLTLEACRPALVVLPETTAQVAAVVRACREAGAPFVPRGAGTGLSGGAHPVPGGVVVECSRMKRILEVDVPNRLAVVQPGVVNADLSSAVAPHGLFYAPDPSSQLACTIGGNVAENSGGPHTLKYGATTNHVLALEIVMPDGEVLRLGSRTGLACGFDLVGTFVGSEGTLGIVTEVTVRLTPIPEAIETLLVIFPDVVSACRSVGEMIGGGLVPAALEILDQRTIAAVEASVYAAGLPLDAGAVLIAELDGPACVLGTQVERMRAIARANRASDVRVAANAAERALFWKARKGAFGAMGRLAPDLYVHDAVVPRAQLASVIEKVCEICDRHRLRLSNVFHAGDGNLHPNISFDRRDPDELERVLAAGAEILEACVAAGGVITGEHGVGVEKRDFLSLVFSEADIDAMLRVRAAFDPERVCNPGKAFPTTRFCAESNPKARGYDQVPLS